ncbi:RsiW-degrading membrane proteinase PrsW (M82 family) [Pseudonocardia sediminis]|uniref:RsiW-degrading membrane proteinase PrsW (M82 family) n=1 Tax=Pseudonocardia sediminis TaxID=1397368 RepID=A0A4Q7V5X3_PSEST|nr:PrsW family glutamic-type intramembrane protease [Pseudonocardia sediminis]RZT89138.1 RsiW-degrading membrane proteinase PrsW (M82 family) [Pseudonocardia sediminis]
MHPTGPRLPAPSVLFPWRAWVAHPLLRSWTTWLFVALVAVPPLGLSLTSSRSTDLLTAAAAFAFYFAAAWFLVLWVVVRPQRVHGALLAQVVALALVVEFPLATWLETVLNADPDNLLLGIVTVGVPEEVAKLVPVAILAFARRRLFSTLSPRDFLFLGAVSGLVFGAVEAVHYAVNVMDVSTTPEALVLVWRLVTGPIAHACWAGVAAYFLGLATRYRDAGPWLALTGTGVGVTAVLHGLNNWVAGDVFPVWVLITVVSTLLFLAYARVGIAVGAPGPDRSPALHGAPRPMRPHVELDLPTMRIPRSRSLSQDISLATGARAS